METFLATLFVIICVLLIIVILLQKGRGVGLSGVFGGLGQSAFGTRTGDVFTWVTIVLTGVFLLLAVGTAYFFRPQTAAVATPTFVPDGRPLPKPINVTVQCGTGGAKIYYTTDGGEPTEQSQRYDAPVRMEPGKTLRARAYRTGWLPSEIAEANYPPPSATTTQAATGPTTTSRPVTTATRPTTTATRPAGVATRPAPAATIMPASR